MLTVEQILMIRGPDVIVASPGDTVYQATRQMTQANVGSVVIAEGGKALGIFTERDLLTRVVSKEKDPKTTPLSEVMSSPVISCGLQDTVESIGGRLSERHIRHLVVIEDGALMGLIGLRDVLSAELDYNKRRVRELEEDR